VAPFTDPPASLAPRGSCPSGWDRTIDRDARAIVCDAHHIPRALSELRLLHGCWLGRKPREHSELALGRRHHRGHGLADREHLVRTRVGVYSGVGLSTAVLSITRGVMRSQPLWGLSGATYMQSALKGCLPLPDNLLKSHKLFSRPCSNSLPCGEGLGVGVAVRLRGTVRS
jgi:hypothetical protein